MSKPTYKRSARIGDQMKEEIADILMRKIKDPRIGFVTVTDVSVSDDLRNATVYVSVYGKSQKETLAGIESASSFIRSELGRRMRVKFVPELIFRYDDAAERGAHIMELLHDIEERDGGKGSDDK
jgi:ribosome-binding factor A